MPYDVDANAADGHGPTVMLGDEPTGQWMLRSAEDSPRFMAANIRTFFGWPDETPAPSYADAKPLDIDRGGYIFATRCAGCHTVGQGDLVGPDLAGVSARRDLDWLSHYIYAPDQMLADGDPVAEALYAKYRRVRMPNLTLDGGDVDAVIAYLNQAGNTTAVARSPD
jgi:protein SCO1